MLHYRLPARRPAAITRLAAGITGVTLLLAACSGSPAEAVPAPQVVSPTVTAVVLATPTAAPVAALPVPAAVTPTPADLAREALSPADQAAPPAGLVADVCC
jgi:hypothetical protein